jgi:1-deoxy-D-xylulose-5-phosphate synthase
LNFLRNVMTGNYKYLSKIDHPSELKKLNADELIILCKELRDFIIDIISSNPGHLGASLGVVELTVALHYVLNAPEDKIIWDVGHQAYAHKILTGRRKLFHTNRRYKGISGFPKMSESIFDSFGVGHSSTSISAALGIAVASKMDNKSNRQIVAVIGDGGLTGGMAFEGLNHAGTENTNLLVILNDNNIAIDPNVGALREYLIDITTSKTYNKFRNEIWHILGMLNKIGPDTRSIAQKVENSLKALLLKQSNLFEAMNFRYFGPVDGHDVRHLVSILSDLKDIPGPKLLHVLTTKGKGFPQAEINPTVFHSPGKFDKLTGELIRIKSDKPQPPRYQDVFGYTLLELAEKNKRIVGITPAMPTGCSLNIMMGKLPERTFDVGIAEQHAVTFAAGLATEGFIPFCNLYSSFMQRGYDQIIHDVALQKLQVVLCLDRAGLVGEDGPTHHGVFDIAALRSIPDIIIAAPMNEEEMRNLMFTAQLPGKGAFVIRYPRGIGVMVDWQKPFKELPVGKARKVRDGKDIAILSIGHPGNFVVEACHQLEIEGIQAYHVDMRFVKPLDEELLHTVFKKFKKIITVEDGVISGGFGSAVIEFMSDNGYSSSVVRLGVPDKFIEHGTLIDLYKECGFDTEGILRVVHELIKYKSLISVQ